MDRKPLRWLQAALQLALSMWNTTAVPVDHSHYFYFFSDYSKNRVKSNFLNTALQIFSLPSFHGLQNISRNSIRKKKLGFGKYGTVFATYSRDTTDACEWHLAQLTLIQITISLASVVWDTQKSAALSPESYSKGPAWGNFLLQNTLIP